VEPARAGPGLTFQVLSHPPEVGTTPFEFMDVEMGTAEGAAAMSETRSLIQIVRDEG
jgi:hypothetical protein